MLNKIDLDTLMYSDTHFKHNGISKYSKKRRALIEKGFSIDLVMWKELYTPRNKLIFHLGDFAWSGVSNLMQDVSAISSDIILLPGNHDTNSINTFRKGFDYVIQGLNIYGKEVIKKKEDKMFHCLVKEISGVKILFSHYPVFDNCHYDKVAKFYPAIERLREVFEENKCDINIHGHTHEKNIKYKSFNVSVENLDFKPISIRDILEKTM